MCCAAGYQAGGISNGTSGGSAISAAGWRFNICQDPGRCLVEPADGISQWYRKMWQVRGLGGLLHMCGTARTRPLTLRLQVSLRQSSSSPKCALM